MKLEVWNETKEIEAAPLILRLVKRDNVVILQAVDEKGRKRSQGDLLRIKPNGRISLWCCVNPDVGLSLDKRGCVEVEAE